MIDGHTGTFLAVAIAKSGHYALAVDATGQVVYQTPMANDEARYANSSSGRLSIRLCWWSINLVGLQRCCCACAGRLKCRSGTCTDWLAMARARDFYVGESKTDPKDAFVLADVARAHPSRIVWLEQTSEALAHLELLCGFDADLRDDANRLTIGFVPCWGRIGQPSSEHSASGWTPVVCWRLFDSTRVGRRSKRPTSTSSPRRHRPGDDPAGVHLPSAAGPYLPDHRSWRPFGARSPRSARPHRRVPPRRPARS